MFEIKFLGTGSAFTLPKSADLNDCDWQSNLLVIAESGKKLLLDCGSDIRFSLHKQGLSLADIDGIYISHLHADHTGGMEWFGFGTFFSPNTKTPHLYCASSIAGPLWNESLKGGLGPVEEEKIDLNTYFNLHCIKEDGHFIWEGIRFDLIQVVHVMTERAVKYSYGLMIYENKKGSPKVFWTSDTKFCPETINEYYERADLILHDCETSKFPSGVHAHYTELSGLPDEFKGKMALYHYHPGAPEELDAEGSGFMGFIKKGNVFVVDRSITWKR